MSVHLKVSEKRFQFYERERKSDRMKYFLDTFESELAANWHESQRDRLIKNLIFQQLFAPSWAQSRSSVISIRRWYKMKSANKAESTEREHLESCEHPLCIVKIDYMNIFGALKSDRKWTRRISMMASLHSNFHFHSHASVNSKV